MARLFEPLTLKSVTTRNRIVISPMCQYSAKEGLANERHFAHLSTFALGGAGIIFTGAAFISNSATQRIGNGNTEFR
jgi:2,4-dienoyl-CoA reductase-like NADH-dependent reductase (Old Yellow Enzyme family)